MSFGYHYNGVTGEIVCRPMPVAVLDEEARKVAGLVASGLQFVQSKAASLEEPRAGSTVAAALPDHRRRPCRLRV